MESWIGQWVSRVIAMENPFDCTNRQQPKIKSCTFKSSVFAEEDALSSQNHLRETQTGRKPVTYIKKNWRETGWEYAGM